MHHTDALNTDTTLDIDDTQATVSGCINPSAHSRLRSMVGYLAERASPTVCDPNEQFEDLTSHKLCVDTGSFWKELGFILFWFKDRSCRDDDPRNRII